MNNSLPKILIGVIIFLAFLGFADSAFLLAKRLSGGPIPCALGFTGCDEVSKSPYSVLFGIPLSAYGMVFYLAIGLLGVLYLDTKKVLVAQLLALGTVFGFILSLYFLYVQKFLIGTFCVYCIASAIIATILFGCGVAVYQKLKTITV